MALTVQSVSDFYNFLSDSRDPRTKDLLFVHPTNIILLEALYLIFTLRVGPWLMKNRPPYDIRRIIRAHNVLQIILNSFICYRGYFILFDDDFSLRCQPVDYSNSEISLIIISTGWWVYFSRIMDLFDTVFFTLRKKNNNLSFLHIYHHSWVILWCALTLNYQVGGNMILATALNSFVHALMYSYYLITSLGPEYKRFLWWKKYLTQLQIFQFVLISIHAFQALFRDCSYHKSFTFMALLQGILFLYLFGNFYKRSYLSPKARSKKD